VRSFVSGLTLVPDAREEDARAAVEEAYLYVRGGWGEVSVGREPGVAARFSAPLPTLLRGAGIIDPSIEPLGPGAVFVRNDVSGRSFKGSVVSQRLLGAAVGASFTPEADHEGLDQGRKDDGIPVFEPENTIEAGLSWVDTFATGVETGFALTAARAESANGSTLFEAMTSYGATVTLARGAMSAALAWLRNDNGWRQGDAPYEAIAGAIAYEQGPWRFALEAGRADDALVRTEIESVAIGAARTIASGVDVAVQAKSRARNSPAGNGLFTDDGQDDTRGVFLSLQLRR
jgi:hypothetical protein